MNLDSRLQRRLYQLLYQHRERRRQYKFYNFLPIIFEETAFDIYAIDNEFLDHRDVSNNILIMKS